MLQASFHTSRFRSFHTLLPQHHSNSAFREDDAGPKRLVITRRHRERTAARSAQKRIKAFGGRGLLDDGATVFLEKLSDATNHSSSSGQPSSDVIDRRLNANNEVGFRYSVQHGRRVGVAEIEAAPA